MVRKILLSLIAVLGLCVYGFAQNRQVSGKVADAEGTPGAGPTVMVAGPSTGTTDNGAADSGKKNDNMPGDDMSGENKKDDSVTGDGMMGDDMDGDGENTTRSVDRRNAAASASDRSRYFGSDKTITHENGSLYGKTYLNPETEKSANAQLRSNGRSLTGTNINGISNDVRYRQMLSNGRVHDTDGFLFDGENTHYNTLR